MNLIELLKYILLGFIQGLTETIPVSSSGHLAIFQRLVELDVDFQTLAIITNFGSLVAIIIFFWNDIIQLIQGFFRYLTTKKEEYKKDYIYCWLIVLGCIPAGIMGIIFQKMGLLTKIEENIKFVGVALLITAALLYFIRNRKGKKQDGEITGKNAFMIGVYQILGLLPGISRSGSTIVGGLAQGLRRDTAFKFSFMMYIPLSLAAMALEVKDLLNANVTSLMWFYYLIAMIVAGVITYIVTKWFREIVNKGKLIYFSIYCAIVGCLVILFL